MLASPSWQLFLNVFAPCFTAPGQRLFVQLVTAWALCPGRRTLTRLWSVIPAPTRRAYSTYARWVREGKWSMDEIWRCLLGCLVDYWAPSGVIELALGDTLIHKTGRKVDGAGIFRDAVRSTASYTVAAWGLNIIILALRITPPWGGEPLALPILVRVHRKGEGELTLLELAATMVWQITCWLPHRQFRLATDGTYASLVGYELPHVEIVTRIRRNAAIYELPPARTGHRGRPRTKGDRLPSPSQLAAKLTDWTT
ncbi:MAG: IS701 family transposase, partial [Candidatus Dormibacteraceae bacterium]